MNAPLRITPEHVAAQAISADYHVFPGTTVTVCCIKLRNGFNAVGQSACVDPALFDAGIGRDIAYKNALAQVWQLEGYLLAEFMHMQRAGEALQLVPGISPADTQDNMDKRPAELVFPLEPSPEAVARSIAETARLEAELGRVVNDVYAAPGERGAFDEWKEPER